VTISRTSGPVEKGAIGQPVQRTTSVRVRARHRSSLVGTYGSIINPGVKTLNGGVVSVTGSPENPTSVVLSGHQTFAPRAIVSMAPSVQLPRGLLSHVVAISYRAGNTVLSLTAASIYEVAPNFQFNVPLQASQATAADFSAGCGLPSGLSPYRRITNVSFSGGWSTADVFGVHIKDGVRADVHFTVEAGLDVTAGVGASCSLSVAFYADGMAGPIPVTAGIEGDLTGSAAVGGELESGGSIEANAGGHTVGFPPVMLLIPDVSFGNPHFTLTAKQFAQATAGIGLTVKAGVGVGGVASLTLNVGSSLNFTAQPGSCLWDARFGQFSAQGELLDWHLSTPQTPALFTQQLGGNFCASSGSGGGGGGTGGGGSGGGGGGGGSGGGAATGPGKAVSTGGDTPCAVIGGGAVACWGYAGASLGNGTTTGPETCYNGSCSTRPVAASGVTTATAISTSLGASCALLATGQVDCWGDNSWGELGTGTMMTCYSTFSPCSTTPVEVAGLTDATAVSTSNDHSCALLTTGQVKCWGQDGVGQLGNGEEGPEMCGSVPCSTTPVAVIGVVNAIGVAAGSPSCALLASGKVDCWDYYSLGKAPIEIPGINTATEIGAGSGYTCALLADGQIDCWGLNESGQLGDGTTSESATPVTVSGITDAIALSAGEYHACALLATGQVDCWGENDAGEIGNGSATGPQRCSFYPGGSEFACSTTPVRVSGISNATVVAAGRWDSCAVLTGGQIDCWGSNGLGGLGNGTTAGPETCEGSNISYGSREPCSTLPVPVLGIP